MGRKLVAVGPTAWALFLSIVLAAPVAQAAGIKVQNANFDYEGRQVIVKGKLDGFGDSAHVVVTDKGNGDELASATVGKQFGFKIPFSSIADVPCEIEIAVGTETASAEVNHCPGPGQFFEFVLTGVVTDEPVPFATVSVTLNGVTYTTTADEFGNYSLPILTDNLNQLVRIDASAENPETGDPIEFVNLAGTFSRIVDGNANGNVTNVTTASYVLALEANGGTEPTTAEELALAETAIDATELFELAALIKLIVDDPAYSLPEGETSLIDFVSDAAAVEA